MRDLERKMKQRRMQREKTLAQLVHGIAREKIRTSPHHPILPSEGPARGGELAPEEFQIQGTHPQADFGQQAGEASPTARGQPE